MNTADKISKRFESEGIDKLPSPKIAGSYVPYVISGKHIYISGQLPWREEGVVGWQGPIDDDKVDYGYEGANRCAKFIIKTIHDALNGDWLRVTRVIKVGGFVQSASGFYKQPQVINGASELITSVFGLEIGQHARFAVGVNALPLNTSVEVDAIIKIDGE